MRWKDWNTKPIRLLRMWERRSSSRAETASPSRRSSPRVGRSRHPRMLRRVDLPEPEGPMIEICSPSNTRRLTVSRATTSPAPRGYTLPASRRSTTGLRGPASGLLGSEGTEVRGRGAGIPEADPLALLESLLHDHEILVGASPHHLAGPDPPSRHVDERPPLALEDRLQGDEEGRPALLDLDLHPRGHARP